MMEILSNCQTIESAPWIKVKFITEQATKAQRGVEV
jgi:hypothetical protein